MRRRHLWLVAAILLILCAYWLTREDPRPAVAPAIEFPREQRPWEAERARERKKPPPPPPEAPAEPGRSARHEVERDPLLAAFSGGEDLAVVVEVNALRHSPVVERLLDCMPKRLQDDLREMRDETGLDPLVDVDRIALLGEAVAVSGFFGDLRSDRFPSSPLGGRGKWLAEGGPPFVALWNDEILLVSRREGEVEEAIDRLEGRLPAVEALPPDLAYGEVYGRISPEAFRRFVSDLPVGAALDGVRDVEIHANVQEAVGLVLDVHGDGRMDDLMRVTRGAIAAARLAATEEGDPRAEAFFQLADVLPRGDGRFSLELVASEALLDDWIREACKSFDEEEEAETLEADLGEGSE